MMMPWQEPCLEPEHDGRLIGYARVSTTDQKLDLQLDALTRAGCDRIYRDHGVSGAKDKRPGLDECLASLRDGDVLVVYKLDRLGRSVLHLADLIDRFEKLGVNFCSLTEGINTTTTGGKLVFHLMSALAEFVRAQIVENTINGQRAARERGVKFGRPRLLDEDAVMEAHRLMAEEGWSVNRLAARFKVSRSTLTRALDRTLPDLAA